jgi:PAS domain S-box-containing protein
MRDEGNRNSYLKAGEAILAELPLAMVLTDPNRPDNPIVYVNRAFEQLTGYSASACIGRNCRFLQDEETDHPEAAKLRRAIAAHEPVTVSIENYRADGSKFLNRLMIAPVLDGEGQLYAFVGIQSEVSEAPAEKTTNAEAFDDRLEEMQHRVKNHLQMVASMIRMQSRETEAKETFLVLSRRVEALALIYDEFNRAPQRGPAQYDVVSAGSYVSRVVATIGALDGRRELRVNVDTDNVHMRTERAAQLGLLASEILSNTLQHAFGGRSEGIVSVALKQLGGDRIRLSVEDDGVGLGDTDWPNVGNLGAKIVRSLVADLGAELGVMSTENGTIVTIDFDNVIDTSLDDEGRRMLSDVAGARTGARSGSSDGPKSIERGARGNGG